MEKYRDILDRAFSAMDNAYAPYSNYYVGACVKTKDGKKFIAQGDASEWRILKKYVGSGSLDSF